MATFFEIFEALLLRYNRKEFLASDPIQFAHRYRDSADREIAAFLSAMFAYGSVGLIGRALEAILAPMGESPSWFLAKFDGKASHWPGFSHRFHDERHLKALLSAIRRAIAEHGSLGGLFRDQGRAGQSKRFVENVLNGTARWFWDEFKRECARTRGPGQSAWRGLRFFINAPEGGSACKRGVMFLRWMSRADEVDLGLWSDWLSPRELIIPVDTHIARLSHFLRLRSGKLAKAPNWAMALEITDRLRAISPDDPVRYDFALTRLGILDVCRRRYVESICETCPVEPVCFLARAGMRGRLSARARRA
ncbi:MAG: TIGR02757 family protein [Deltaproteobacteria bacterium]|nr:TIGR02757 family protein [Deltaproteobacteria bacterium]